MKSSIRIGQGFDVHAFSPDRPLILGGVQVPFEKGLAGHSDADVLLHAVTDALLGALGWGDIGKWFPDSDSQWKGADSAVLLEKVWQRAAGEGWVVVNCDCTVLAERPKLAPYIDSMNERVADILGTQAEQVSVKATTTEKLGFVGREEGIAAMAVILIEKVANP